MPMTTSKLQDGELTIRIEHDIDHHIAKQLREEIDEQIRRSAPARVRLDFEAVGFMDSAGVGLIMGRHRLTESMGIPLRVCRLSEQCRRVVEMSQLPDLIDISRS
ncbi:MAG: STAS domain-containing protein [Oscillospiraceae bacterium]|nr:STAS domain-containing protein [Oscillospiraceae bacterium]